MLPRWVCGGDVVSVALVRTNRPVPIRAIEIMGAIGIAFWAVTIVRAFIEGSGNAFVVLLVGLVLAAAHAVVAIGANRRSITYLYAIGFIFVGDLLLAIFVDSRAFALVAFTVVLGVLAATPSARRWQRGSS